MKFLELKDFVEISLLYNILPNKSLTELIHILYLEDEINTDYSTVFPLSLYKLIVQYEQMDLFDECFSIELEHPNRSNSNSIADIIGKFSYKPLYIFTLILCFYSKLVQFLFILTEGNYFSVFELQIR